MLDEAYIIEQNGVELLVFPEEECKEPTLKFIELGTVAPELYDEIYEKYLAKKYEYST